MFAQFLPRVRLHEAYHLLCVSAGDIVKTVFDNTQSHGTLSAVSGFRISPTFAIVFPTFRFNNLSKPCNMKSADILVVTEETTTYLIFTCFLLM